MGTLIKCLAHEHNTVSPARARTRIACWLSLMYDGIKKSQHARQNFWDFNFLGQGKLLFTMDITSLYTVIPNAEGLLALKHFFDQRTVKEPKSETLLRLAELVLTLNFHFHFHFQFFIRGQLFQTNQWHSQGNQNGTQLY